ncbi:MAG TPA: RNB domain-containing ribonuclease [Methylophilaceae bacterium]|jgi:exoribonuclease-2
MNVFYEEDGGFKVASVMSETDSSLQVESVSGKRTKIKAANVLLRFESALQGFMEAAQAEADTLDTDFLWECCVEEEFSFDDLAKEYYGGKPTSMQSAAIAIKLHSAPVYFYRKGKGNYKAAPADILKAALAGLEKKRLQAEQVANMAEQLKAQGLPESFKSKLDMLFYAPDKNTLEWKALEQATNELHLLPIQVLANAGAIASNHDYHLGAFLREYFANGTDFDEYEIAPIPNDLPLSDVEAFSIDDSSTTEIDDALSVKVLANGNTQVGIHIAAPALGVLPNTPLDNEVMKRLSTVYMPGNKITMLPEAAIRPFSLDAGEIKPVLSLYIEVAPDFSVVQRNTRLERMKIAENLRHDSLEPYFNESTLEADSGHPYWSQLLYLFNFAESLEKARGKYDPTRPPQVDYNFYVTDGIVRIVNRQRGSPMDKLVAELMIEANSQWGALLAEKGLPGIYRAQNGGKVYMTTKAEGHQGLGVAQYAWSTSPLRRAVDLINQRQLIAAIGYTTPVYLPERDEIVGHMRNFDQTYNAYNEFQTRMERYWCLQYLVQENIQLIGATVWRENLVRLDELPYITKVHSLPELATGTKVKLEVKKVDALLMELDCKFVGAETATTEITTDAPLE